MSDDRVGILNAVDRATRDAIQELVHGGYLALFTDDAGVERVALTMKGFDFLERVLPHLESNVSDR